MSRWHLAPTGAVSGGLWRLDDHNGRTATAELITGLYLAAAMSAVGGYS